MLEGVGIGLRASHYSFIETVKPDVLWFEVLTDNYLCQSGSSLFHLEKILAHYPITLHGVGMSLGSTDPLNWTYLKTVKSLIQRVKPHLVSDHLCWTSFAGRHFHELLPLPYTDEAVLHTAKRIRKIQDFLGQQIMIENVSSYLFFPHATLREWEFLQAVAQEADCLILLDINNIYVSGHNNGFDPLTYLSHLSSERVAQFHLAGFEDCGTHLLDTHGATVSPAVWELFKVALTKFGSLPTAIEWDNHLPNFPHLLEEAEIAKNIMATIEKQPDRHLTTVKGRKETACPSLFETQKNFIAALTSHASEIQIYSDSIKAAFQNVLKDIYPVCGKLVGETFFLAMTERYIQITPSLSPDLAEYGETFSEFIQRFQPAESLPYLADVARLEWGIHRLFYARDDSPFDLSELVVELTAGNPDLVFHLPYDSVLLSSSYPIHQIWKIHQSMDSELETFYLPDKNNVFYLFIFRRDLDIQIDELKREEWQILNWINSQFTLGQISEQTSLEPLTPILTRGWIRGFTKLTCIQNDFR